MYSSSLVGVHAIKDIYNICPCMYIIKLYAWLPQFHTSTFCIDVAEYKLYRETHWPLYIPNSIPCKQLDCPFSNISECRGVYNIINVAELIDNSHETEVIMQTGLNHSPLQQRCFHLTFTETHRYNTASCSCIYIYTHTKRPQITVVLRELP